MESKNVVPLGKAFFAGPATITHNPYTHDTVKTQHRRKHTAYPMR